MGEVFRHCGPGDSAVQYRVWVVMLTEAYADDVLAALVRYGFKVSCAEEPCIRGGTTAVLSFVVELGDRIVVGHDGNSKVAPHQCSEVRSRIAQVLDARRVKVHAVVVAVAETAAWNAGNIDLAAVGVEESSS